MLNLTRLDFIQIFIVNSPLNNNYLSSKTITKIMRLKIHLVIGFFAFFVTTVNAQTPVCKPDTIRYRDSLSGVYPLPYIDSVRPNGGIDKVACLTKAYSFVWTIKVGDTLTVPNPFGAGTIQVPLDSVLIGKSSAIAGMPTGLSYACNPPNCVWKKQTYGCVALSGSPAATNAIKTYPLVISGKAYPGGFYASLFPNGYDLTFPGAIAPGSYDLKVYAANDTRCTTAADDLTEVSGMTAVPNPTNGKTVIRIESTVSDKFTFNVTDLLGRRVISRPLSIQSGQNTFDLDVTGLPNGIYIYTLSKGNRVMSNKLIINQ